MRQLINSGIRNKIKRLIRPEAQYPRGDRYAKILSVATIKGGVGKTTTAVNLAIGLTHIANARVLLIDLDAQGHCTTSLSSCIPSISTKYPISEVLLRDEKLQLLDAIASTHIDKLDITPADPMLAEAEGRISQKIGKELLLRDALSITRTHYDYIIIDCPPNKGNLTLNALLASSHVLIPTDLSPLAVQGADELLSTVVTVNERLHHELDIAGILLTRVDGRNSSMNSSIREDIQNAWGELVFSTEIGVNTRISQAQHAGVPIYEFDPKSRGAQHYDALTRELLQTI